MCRCSFWKKGGRHKYDDDRETPPIIFRIIKAFAGGGRRAGSEEEKVKCVSGRLNYRTGTMWSKIEKGEGKETACPEQNNLATFILSKERA